MSDQIEKTTSEATQPPATEAKPARAPAGKAPRKGAAGGGKIGRARGRAAGSGKQPAEEPATPEGLTRREFLNYIWTATMALLLVETTGISILFSFPRFKEGEFGGVFSLGVADQVLPDMDDPPEPNDVGKYWLTQNEEGVLALYKVCTHLGCLYKWVDQTNRFECPCHGSKFTKKGEYIEGPAPRNLDRFVVEAVDEAGNVVASTDAQGDPLPLPSQDLTLQVDTGRRISGKPHA
ncbi:MAG: ubiquinol-cytochrome c reductase iron-sulfur subunit [Anaerolineae bacterium]